SIAQQAGSDRGEDRSAAGCVNWLRPTTGSPSMESASGVPFRVPIVQVSQNGLGDVLPVLEDDEAVHSAEDFLRIGRFVDAVAAPAEDEGVFVVFGVHADGAGHF